MIYSPNWSTAWSVCRQCVAPAEGSAAPFVSALVWSGAPVVVSNPCAQLSWAEWCCAFTRAGCSNLLPYCDSFETFYCISCIGVQLKACCFYLVHGTAWIVQIKEDSCSNFTLGKRVEWCLWASNLVYLKQRYWRGSLYLNKESI